MKTVLNSQADPAVPTCKKSFQINAEWKVKCPCFQKLDHVEIHLARSFLWKVSMVRTN